MKISELKQPYRRMAEYLSSHDKVNMIKEREGVIYNHYPFSSVHHHFWFIVDNGNYPEITEEIKRHFPTDFDFSGEKGFVYPYDKNYLKIPMNEHSTLLIPKDDLMEKTTNEEKIVYWAKNLEHKSLSLHELVEEGKWLVSHCSNIEDNNQKYTQLAKEGKFDELPATCEFSEAVELEVSNNKEFFELYKITGKYRESFISGPPIGQIYAYRNAQLPTPKIDFSQFTTDDVVEVETNKNGLFYGVFCVNEVDFIRITFGDKSDLTKQFYKDQIKSITKIK